MGMPSFAANITSERVTEKGIQKGIQERLNDYGKGQNEK